MSNFILSSRIKSTQIKNLT